MSYAFSPLAPADEDALHRARLLNTEERAFKRITKRLLAPGTFSVVARNQNGTQPTEVPPEDGVDNAEEGKVSQMIDAEEYDKLREEILMDFAAFEANLVRTQLLLNSNAKERERYAAEKTRIQETAQQVRENTGELRTKLEEAQKILEQRKGWDKLAEKITNNRMLRAREEQLANIEKLNNEIAELEQESRDYAATWAERRQQFGRIVDEGMQMLRLIRDEKEEVERREGMEGQEDGDDTDAARGGISTVGTPRPEGGATPLHTGNDIDNGDGMLHPLAKTPLRGSPVPEGEVSDHDPVPANDTDMADEDEGEVEEDDNDDDDDDDNGGDDDDGDDENALSAVSLIPDGEPTSGGDETMDTT